MRLSGTASGSKPTIGLTKRQCFSAHCLLPGSRLLAPSRCESAEQPERLVAADDGVVLSCPRRRAGLKVRPVQFGLRPDVVDQIELLAAFGEDWEIPLLTKAVAGTVFLPFLVALVISTAPSPGGIPKERLRTAGELLLWKIDLELEAPSLLPARLGQQRMLPRLGRAMSRQRHVRHLR